jgi:hypothetical protein
LHQSFSHYDWLHHPTQHLLYVVKGKWTVS